jgi:hypothetical protein
MGGAPPGLASRTARKAPKEAEAAAVYTLSPVTQVAIRKGVTEKWWRDWVAKTLREAGRLDRLTVAIGYWQQDPQALAQARVAFERLSILLRYSLLSDAARGYAEQQLAVLDSTLRRYETPAGPQP